MSSRFPPGTHIPDYAPQQQPPLMPYHETSVFQPSSANFVLPQQYPNGIAPWHTPTQSHQMQPDIRDPAHERQRGPPVTEQKKHKRTRSGCFTCRTRRVKVRRFRSDILPALIHL